MFPSAEILPSLPDPQILCRDDVTTYLEDIQRLKVFYPTATTRAFLPRNVSKAIEYEFGVTVANLTDLEVDDHLWRLVAPRTSAQLREALGAIACHERPTVTRLANLRAFTDEFLDLYQARNLIEDDIAAQMTFQRDDNSSGALIPTGEPSAPSEDAVSDDEAAPETDDDAAPARSAIDAFERDAMKLLRRLLRPTRFAAVFERRHALVRPKSLVSLIHLVLEVADEEDIARDEADRFGFLTASRSPRRGPMVAGPGASRSGPALQSSRDRHRGQRGNASRTPSQFDASRSRPCRACGGAHWDRDCPQHRSRSNGGLRPNPQRSIKATGTGMSTTAKVNGRSYSLLIDTGADISCVTEAATETVREEPGSQYIEGPTVVANTAGDSTIRSSRYLRTTMSVDNICGWPVSFPGEFLVIPGGSPQFIIGTDLLTDLGALSDDGLVLRFNQPRNIDADDDFGIISDYVEGGVNLNAVEVAPPNPADLVDIPDSPFRPQLLALVREFSDLFGPLPAEGSKLEPQRIPLSDETALVQLRARPLSNTRRVKVGEEVDRLRTAGIIEDSQGPYSSPIVVVDKKTEAIRLCIDYTLLNKLTIPDHFPLPDLRTFLSRASGCSLFAALDLQSGYHQQLLHPDDIPKTAFVTPDSYCQFRRVPFGLRNAPAGFQRAMQKALAPVLDAGVAVYIDDILAFARGGHLFVELIHRLFCLLRKYKLRLAAEKCVIGAAHVRSVGFIVDSAGVRIDPDRAQAVRTLTPPRDVTELRGIIGKFNYISTFIPDLARRLATLNELTKKGVEFEWTPKHQEAFESLKMTVTSETVLAFPSLNGTAWHLYTDASTTGIGGYLVQCKPDGTNKEIVSFFSKKFNDTQTRWSTYEQELFGVIYCLSRPELAPLFRLHPDLTVHTDHRNLVYLDRSAPSNKKILRWKLLLADYPVKIVHVSGAENVVADVLSRHLHLLSSDQSQVLKRYHAGTAGHQKAHQMIKQLHTDGYSWKGMCNDVRQYTRECLVCQRLQRPRKQPTETHPTHTLTPFALVQMDTVGPLPMSRGMRYVIVVIDCFTKFVELIPVATTSAKEAAEALLATWARYGVPRVLQTDRGSQFLNHLVHDVVEIVGGTHRFSTAYHPASNGIVERANGTLATRLRALLLDRNTEEWCRLLPVVQHAYNTTIHSSTGVTPFEALYGSTESKPVQDPTVWLRAYGALEQLGPEWGRKFSQWREALDDTRKRAQEQLAHTAKPNRPVDGIHEWQSGQLTLITHSVRPPKLSPRLRGPLEVVRRGESPNTWYVRDLPSRVEFLVHQERMIPFFTSLDRATLTTILEKEVGYYEVDFIVDHRLGGTDGKTLEIRIRWLGYEPEEDSWETFTLEHNELEAVDKYIQEQPDAADLFKDASDRLNRRTRRGRGRTRS